MRADPRGPARSLRAVLLAVLLLLPIGIAHTQSPAVTWESGSGDDVELWRLGVQGAPRPMATVGTWSLSMTWEVQIGRWTSRTSSGGTPGVWDLGITPLVRFLPPAGHRWRAFVEGAVGAHLISRNKVHPRLDMSSAYQFGDHLGLGVQLGAVEVVFRHQHLSNASTVQPNHGANFNMLRVVYYLE